MKEMEEFMESYIFESIEHQKELPINVFVTSIDSSCFHWHYDYEVVLVLKGSIVIYMGADRYTLRAGDIILSNSKSIHSLSRTHEDNICLFIQIHPDLLNYSAGKKNRSYNFYLNSADPNIRIKKDYYLFKKTAANIGLAHFSEGDSKEYRLKAHIFSLFADLFDYTVYDIQQYARNVDTYESPEAFVKIITFIEKNYTSSTLTEDLCKSVGMSQPTLYRFLKNTTGLTIHDVVRSFKTEKAKAMLKATDKTISFISQECGYSNEMSFYRAFKKETGITPTEYRLSGSIAGKNLNVQGYLSFNRNEALKLLEQYI